MALSAFKEAMKKITISSCFSLLISAAPATHAAPPAKLEITYEVSQDGTTIAELTERLEHGKGAYQLTETWRGRGIFSLLRGHIKRSSRGSVLSEGLRPIEYVDERTGREPARARFDWAARTLTQQYQGPAQSVQMPPDAQDRLSFLLAFAFIPPTAAPVSFSIADGKGVSRQIYEIVARERVSTPAGDFDAVKLARRKDGPDDKRATDIWLATEKSHIPVRLLITEKDGSRINQVATRIVSAP
jgi:hypothetical protein